MRLTNIHAAQAECKRFLARVAELEKALSRFADKDQETELGFGLPESGAVRRASMDLTRALAKMRKG